MFVKRARLLVFLLLTFSTCYFILIHTLLSPRDSVYFFDAAQELQGVPKCDVEDPMSEALHVKRMASLHFPQYTLHHSLDQHSGPWYLGQALHRLHGWRKRAGYVYVDLSCYYNWYWWSRYLTPEQRSGLIIDPEKVLSHVMDLIPHHVLPYKAAVFFPAPYNTGCEQHPWLKQALNIVVEKGASCNEQRTFVVPYNSNLDAPNKDLRFDNRKTFLTYIGGAAKEEDRSSGQLMRNAVSAYLRDQPSVFLFNGCLGCHGQMPHEEAVQRYQQSVFCLVLPGDTQSSRRASEVIVHGCIPVFLGSPFNTAPFSDSIDYRRFALFVNVVSNGAWVLTDDHKWQVEHWTPDVPETQSIDDLHSLLPMLNSLSTEQIHDMQMELQKYRRTMIYTTSFDSNNPSAVDVILDLLQSV
jgi:hypothetical protein